MTLQVHLDAIPEELKSLPRWVNWEYIVRSGKSTKKPIDPRTGGAASCNDSSTWGPLRQALDRLNRGEADGTGFQLGPPYVGIDLDKCRDPETGAIEPWAQRIIDELDSYTEISPSGRGVHIWGKGTLPCGPRRRSQVEMYSGGRYLTVTGHHLAGTPKSIKERSSALKSAHARYLSGREHKASARGGNPSPSDTELIEGARKAKNGAKFERLWKGDFHDYESQSEGDLALCSMLAFWTRCDTNQIDRLFRQSGLYRPKWDERHGAEGQTYGQLTVARSMDHTTSGRSRSDGRRARNRGRIRMSIIVNDRHPRQIADDALKALKTANNPSSLYVRSGSVVRVRPDEKGRPVIDTVGTDELCERLFQGANFFRRRNRRTTPCAPPENVIRAILARGKWPFPPLEGITEAPVLRTDGTVLSKVGYDPATHLIYHPARALKIPQIPARPSPEDVSQARALVNEAIGEFPYADEASWANAAALLLTPILRPAIQGPVPLCCITSPQGGTGKGLLTSVAASITTGREASLMPSTTEEEEWRKRITSVLVEGATFICIDNIEDPLWSSALSAVLTAEHWQDRILGKTATLTVPQRATWVANGNNLRLSRDLRRRSYWIRLDARVSRPWKRNDFKHRQLLSWVRDHRGELLAALLTISRAWFAARRPAADVPVMGSFESWTRMMGGILKHAGIVDPGTRRPAFLADLEESQDLADDSDAEWQDFLCVILEAYGSAAFTVKALAARTKVDKALMEALPLEFAADIEEHPGRFQIRLGCAFSNRENTRVGDSEIHIERAGTEHRATRWRVVVG